MRNHMPFHPIRGNDFFHTPNPNQNQNQNYNQSHHSNFNPNKNVFGFMKKFEDAPKRDEVRFSDIPKIVPPRRNDNILSEYFVLRQDLEKESPNMDLTFYYSMKLNFRPDWTYFCHKIELKDVGKVEINGLQLNGSISVIRSTLILNDCVFEKPLDGVDYFISVTNSSKCQIINSSFTHTKLYGICVDEYSELTLESCVLWSCGQSCLSVTGNSKCLSQNSTFADCEANLISVKTESEITLLNCVLKDSKKKGISNINGTINLHDCVFTNNLTGAIFIDKSTNKNIIKNCKIMNSNGVSITVEKSNLALIDSQIENSRKGGFRCLQNSKVMIDNCVFSGSKWALLNLYDDSHLICQNTLFESSIIRGITATEQSHLYLKGCTFRYCTENGLRVIGTQNVKVKNCIFHECRVSGIDICDNGYAKINDCTFAGGFEYGLNLYTGGSCVADQIYIFGPFRYATRIHHGGFGNFSNVLMQNLVNPLNTNSIQSFTAQSNLIRLIDNNHDIIYTDNDNFGDSFNHKKVRNIMDCYSCEDKHHHRNYDKRFFKIDSKYFISVTNSYIVGIGNYELIANPNNILNRKCLDDLEPLPSACKECGKDATRFHFSPCGHCIYCQECWNKLEKKPKRCGLCKAGIDKAVPRVDCGEDGVCPICYDSPVNVIILPCGHSICKECSAHWFQTSSQCPFCREPNSKIRQIVTYA